MEKKSKISEKLDAIAKPSKWIEESNFRLENKERLRYSQRVAVIVLRALRAQGITQKGLAEMLNITPQTVSKWVKGSENFTFDTIVKLNQALNISIFPQLENIEEQHTENRNEIIPVKTEPKVISLYKHEEEWSEELMEN